MIKETVIVPEIVKETVVVKETVEVEVSAPVETVPAPPSISKLVLTAMPVAEMPVIDGSAGDEIWKEAKDMKAGVMNMKAVYTADDIAFLITWPDRDLSINSRGTWNWDSEQKTWWRTGFEEGTWESYRGNRHPEWFNLAFDISSVVEAEGCYAFCHEYPVGSGIWHHNTAGSGQYVDSWGPLGKHGYGQKFLEDMGWLAGGSGVVQEGEVIFDPDDPIDSHQVLSGNITFFGYAEDKVIVPLDDPNYPKTDRPADVYCIKCHEDQNAIYWTKTGNTTYGDDGDLPYYPNWDEAYAAPIYMEMEPTDFADSMVLTQAEIDGGETAVVAELTPAQVAQYWANYAELNGVVPHLVLTDPTGSQADVLSAANWTNGIWTVELTRKMVNGNFDDVQFDDLDKAYNFGISLWNHTDLLAPLLREVGAEMVFQQ